MISKGLPVTDQSGKQTIGVGDRVERNAGSPEMIVVDIEPNALDAQKTMLTCSWKNPGGTVQESQFCPSSLTLVMKAPYPTVN